MKKQSFLNDIFETNNNPNEPDRNIKLNTIMFSNCFGSKTGPSYRHRQIRILQIGNSSSIKGAKKPVLITKTKIPSTALMNNEIFKDDINSILKVEPTKRENRASHSQKSQHQNRLCQTEKPKNKNSSPEKDEINYRQYLSITESPKKSVLCLKRKKNIISIPERFKKSKKIQYDNQQLGHENQADQVTRSVNLFNKIKIMEEKFEPQQTEKRTFTNLQNRKKNKFKVQQNRKTPQEAAEEERKLKLQIKRQISMDYAKPFNPPTNISAYSYIVYEPQFSTKIRRKNYTLEAKLFQTGMTDQIRQNIQKKYPHSHKILASVNSRNAVEVASLTKIMTCILALDICALYKLDAMEEKIVIGKFESNIGGTTAQICEGQTYTLEDLYYGLMLPSGNDASVAIAVWGGRVLLTKEEDQQTVHKKKDCYNRFLLEMNNKAKQLGLIKTTYANSHGLVNQLNKSCAYDLAVLCEYAMKNKKFQDIVSCKVYQAKITYLTKNGGSPNPSQKKSSMKVIKMQKPEKDDEIEEGIQMDLDSNEDDEFLNKEEELLTAEKMVQWQNTHRLLQQKSQQYIGIKTGITTAAGPCLASCIKSKDGRYFIIIVLGCDRMSMRFKDTENLKRWAYNREGVQSPKKREREERQTYDFNCSVKPMNNDEQCFFQ